MRTLVACPRCSRQFDVSAKAAGTRLACPCGAELLVPAAEGRDAAVVRCSACGAPRLEGAAACAFCGSHFTLREQDLNTLCPHCLARVSDLGRYCHFCGTRIAPEAWTGGETSSRCPACGPDAELRSRSLAAPGPAESSPAGLRVDECPRCGGMWVAEAAFQALIQRGSSPTVHRLGGAMAPAAHTVRHRDEAGADDKRPLYRPCPVCHRLMNRHNYGQRSGVILDICANHGIWFDRDELAEILAWTAAGGAERAEAVHAMVQHEEERSRKLARRFEPRPNEETQGSDVPGWAYALEIMLETLGRYLSRWK